MERKSKTGIDDVRIFIVTIMGKVSRVCSYKVISKNDGRKSKCKVFYGLVCIFSPLVMILIRNKN